MNGRDFLDTARHLAGRPSEADARSAVSRAYYAAFHVARDFLSSLGLRTPRADRAHNFLYVRLNNCGEPYVEHAAFLMNKLRGLRNQSDYDVQQKYVQTDVPKLVADAENVVRSFDAVTPGMRKQITEAMKGYERQIGDVTWRP